MTRSVRIHEFGGPEVLRVDDVAVGEPGTGEVRLRIHAIGLNRTELTLRSGRLPVKPSLPSPDRFRGGGCDRSAGPQCLRLLGRRSGGIGARLQRLAIRALRLRHRSRPRGRWSPFPTTSASSRLLRPGWRSGRRGAGSSRSGLSRPGRAS